MAYYFFFHALVFQTAADKPAYQILLSLDKYLAPDDLCLDVLYPQSPAQLPDSWAAGSAVKAAVM